MENENLQPQEGSTEQVETEELNFFDKVTGVFYEPSRVFESISKFPTKNMDWLMPTIFVVLFVIITQFIMFSNPAVQASMKETQIKAMQKYVDEGKMTQEQMDQYIDQSDKYKGMQYIGVFVGVPIVSFIVLFIAGLVYWLVAKFGLRGNVNYMAVLVVYALTGMISLLEILSSTVLTIMMGKVGAAPSLALLIPNMEGIAGTLLNKINPFTFWWLFVLGVGLSKISKKDTSQGLMLVGGIWVGYIILVLFVFSKIPFLSFLK